MSDNQSWSSDPAELMFNTVPAGFMLNTVPAELMLNTVPAGLMFNTVPARDMTVSCARCTIASQLCGVHCSSYSWSHGGNAAGHFNNVAPIKASQTALPCLRCIDTLLHTCVICTLDMQRETAAHIMTVLPNTATAVS